jgi:phospholipid-binding lipoprotein MlaA
VGPGNYTVLPVLGPKTERDIAGIIVDTALNPLGHFLPETEQWYARGIRLGDKAAGALRYGDAIGDVLNESADPYLAARTVYLQNRRFELTGGAVEDAYVDPYEELYGN